MRKNFNRILARSADNGRVSASLNASQRSKFKHRPPATSKPIERVRHKRSEGALPSGTT